MAKPTVEDRVAYLERFNARLVAAIERHFHLRMEPDDLDGAALDADALDAMTKAELVAYAADKKIDLAGAVTKADIIAAIELAGEPATI